jgi:hypothetical protein
MLLSHRARHRHVVGHFHHQRGDVAAELTRDLFLRRVSILDGIVEQRGLENRQILDAADRGDQRRDFDRMIDVWRLMVAFAALVAVLSRGKRECAQEGGVFGNAILRRNGAY